MKPLHFGANGRRLYGVYHPPAEDGPPRDSAVLIAGPWMGEYNASHRVLKNLATLLADDGFPTLRFDYWGSGDSEGETGSATLADHVEDFEVAAAELAELSGVQGLTAVGRGLGAVVALQASRRRPLRSLVLWEPVVSGHDYLAELLSADARQRLLRLLKPLRAGASELLGFALRPAVEQALASADALRGEVRIESRALIVGERELPGYGALLRKLSEQVRDARLEIVSDEQASAPRSKDAQVLASKPLQVISRWLASGGPA